MKKLVNFPERLRPEIGQAISKKLSDVALISICTVQSTTYDTVALPRYCTEYCTEHTYIPYGNYVGL